MNHSITSSSFTPSLESIKPASKSPLNDNEVTIFENQFIPDSLELHSKVHWLIENEVGYIDDVLRSHECDGLIKAMDLSKSMSFWSNKGRENQESRAFRDADTVEIHSHYIASALWNRVQSYLNHLKFHFPALDDGTDAWQVDLIGDWSCAAINHDLLLARYPSGGYFSPHTDGNVIANFNLRSFFSVIVFLNDIPPTLGGGTKFYQSEASNNLQQTAPGHPWTADEKYCIFEVEARAGRFLFFHQKYVHEGVMPREPFQKHIIRTDIMFTRHPLLLTSPEDSEAYTLHQQAEYLAELGRTAESIKLFKMAFKMSPSLSRLMGQS